MEDNGERAGGVADRKREKETEKRERTRGEKLIKKKWRERRGGVLPLHACAQPWEILCILPPFRAGPWDISTRDC